jgi:hypothetical protein
MICRFYSLFIACLLLAAPIITLAQGQTVVGTVSGGLATITASSSALTAGFDSEYNDGSVYTSVEQYNDGVTWYLIGNGYNGSEKRRSSYPLTLIGTDLFLDTSAAVQITLCSILGCSSFPCTHLCNEPCPSGQGSGTCTSSSQPLIAAGHLGTFY